MIQGYPTKADIMAKLAALGIEECTEWSTDWVEEAWQKLYNLAMMAQWAISLRVYAASDTTINVVSGSYLYKGTVKTFTAGTAINPTDNDTTYVWMTPTNTIGSGINGSGWPVTEHIKLAEVDVDADGLITDIRDMRGQAFLSFAGFDSGSTPIVLKATLTAGSTVAIFTAAAPYKFQIIDAWSIAKSADAGTWKLTDGTNDITNAVAVTATDKTINRAGTIDDAYNTIAANGSLSVVGDGTLADVDVFISVLKVL